MTPTRVPFQSWQDLLPESAWSLYPSGASSGRDTLSDPTEGVPSNEPATPPSRFMPWFSAAVRRTETVTVVEQTEQDGQEICAGTCAPPASDSGHSEVCDTEQAFEETLPSREDRDEDVAVSNLGADSAECCDTELKSDVPSVPGKKRRPRTRPRKKRGAGKVVADSGGQLDTSAADPEVNASAAPTLPAKADPINVAEWGYHLPELLTVAKLGSTTTDWMVRRAEEIEQDVSLAEWERIKAYRDLACAGSLEDLTCCMVLLHVNERRKLPHPDVEKWSGTSVRSATQQNSDLHPWSLVLGTPQAYDALFPHLTDGDKNLLKYLESCRGRGAGNVPEVLTMVYGRLSWAGKVFEAVREKDQRHGLSKPPTIEDLQTCARIWRPTLHEVDFLLCSTARSATHVFVYWSRVHAFRSSRPRVQRS